MKKILLLIFTAFTFNCVAQNPYSQNADSAYKAKAAADSLLAVIESTNEYLNYLNEEVNSEVMDWEFIIKNKSRIINLIRKNKSATYMQIVTMGNLLISFDSFVEGFPSKFNNTKNSSGVLIIVSADDQRIKIIASTDLSSKLIDQKSQRIIDTIMIPEFKKGNYDAGIEKGILEIIKILEN